MNINNSEIDNKPIICDEQQNNPDIFNKYVYINEITYKDEKKNLIMLLTAKCANSTIANLCYNLHYGKTEILNKYNPWNWGKYYMHDKYININDYDNRLCVAVFRDPIERLMSSYNTIKNYGVNCSLEEYCEYLINSLEYTGEKFYIDRHITSQFKFHKYNDIDLYMNINDLNDFFNEINICTPTVNVSRERIYCPQEYRDKFLELLKNDYDMYNNIINSDKMYKKS